MPKNLIVITKLFPYNFTEAFLESETPFLQEKFKNITNQLSVNYLAVKNLLGLEHI